MLSRALWAWRFDFWIVSKTDFLVKSGCQGVLYTSAILKASFAAHVDKFVDRWSSGDEEQYEQRFHLYFDWCKTWLDLIYTRRKINCKKKFSLANNTNMTLTMFIAHVKHLSLINVVSSIVCNFPLCFLENETQSRIKRVCKIWSERRDQHIVLQSLNKLHKVNALIPHDIIDRNHALLIYPDLFPTCRYLFSSINT